MRFELTALQDAWLILPEAHVDERGFFTRTFCENEFAARGLPVHYPQSNLSHNNRAGTLRGMHINTADHWESKVVRCTRGAVHDVIVDLRVTSSTYGRWMGVDLSVANGIGLFVPEGFAHGFLTLAEDTDVTYQMSRTFEAEVGIGFRWNDPAFDIRWPIEPLVINERDATYLDYEPSRFGG